MLSSSARRVACSAQPSHFIGCVSSVYRAISPQSLSIQQSHQRRSSSSKPSNPANGSKGIAERRAVPTGPAQTCSDGNRKPSTRSRRKAKEAKEDLKEVAANFRVKARDKAMHNLPSVPSTHHVKAQEIVASAFFSLHRPISVTSSFPKAVTDEVFASIFTSRIRANARPSNIISTLSNTIHKLESVVDPNRANGESDELMVAITAGPPQAEGDVKHLDQGSAEVLLPFPQHILSGDYQPFNPPPAPQPMDSADDSLTTSSSSTTTPETQTQHRTYRAVLTIQESTHANGEVTYMAHSSPLVAEAPGPHLPQSDDTDDHEPTRYRERMNIRRERYEECLLHRRRSMWGISVKRQRKLKMKKHKYKKLMRRTRNLRRRLDRN